MNDRIDRKLAQADKAILSLRIAKRTAKRQRRIYRWRKVWWRLDAQWRKIRHNIPVNLTKLGDLLTEAQITRVLELMQEHPDDIDLAKALREYLGTFGEELTKKGMLPSYAEYAIPYAIRAGMLERN